MGQVISKDLIDTDNTLEIDRLLAAGNVKFTEIIYKFDKIMIEIPGIYCAQIKDAEMKSLDYAIYTKKFDIAKKLIEAGSPLAPVNKKHANPLYLAVYHNNYDLVKLLIDKGADTKTDDPITVAISNKNIDIIRLLATKYNEPIQCQLIQHLEDDNLIKMFLGRGTEIRKDTIYILYQNRQFDSIEFIVNNIDKLIFHEKQNVIELLIYNSIKYGKKEFLDVLFLYKFDINKIFEENSYLHEAISIGNIDIVTRLLEMGANINLHIDSYPIHYISLIEDIDIFKQLLDLLLQYGADINSKNKNNKNVLSYCIGYQCPINNIKYLISKGIDLNNKDSDDYTPLIYACYVQQNKIAKLLIESGADVTIANKKGETALSILNKQSNKEVLDLLNGIEMPQIEPLNLKPIGVIKTDNAELLQSLTCTICLNTFTDPIIISSGHTFDRHCIENIDECPLTKQIITWRMTNHTIRQVLLSLS